MNEEAIFLAAMTLDKSARDAFLLTACQGDEALRARVLALLTSHDEGGDFLRRPVIHQCFTPIDSSHASADSTNDDVNTPSDARKERFGYERFHATAEFLADLPDSLRQAMQPTTNVKAFGRVGHYDLLDILGVGGFGIVIKAFDQTLQRLVAIKFLASDLSVSSSARQRFLREARVAAAVRHDFVVNLFAVIEHPLPYLVMEYIDGVTLEQWRRKHPSPPIAAILRIGLQIAQGLAAAHQQGLIHRDIKPANILIEHATQRVKITDFGLARAVDDTTLTRTNFIIGTPQYMSPEQAEGKRVDARSDLFSLGSVLYWLCTNAPPFTGDSSLAVLKQGL